MSTWPMVKLGQVAQFINGDRGKNYPSEGDFAEEGIPFINAGHLTNGEVDFSEMNYIKESRFNLLGSGKTKQNDILYCLRGSLGKTAIVRQKRDAAIASSLVIIRPSDDCNVGYLYHFLTSPYGHVEVRRFDNGSSQPNLSANSVKSYLMPLPPLSAQARIAELLDRAKALRAKRRAALAQLDSLTRSHFFDLFGDPAINPKGWPCVPFAELGENQDAQRVPVKSADRNGRKGKYPYYGASGIIDWVDDFIYDGERLLIGEDGANLVARATPVAYIARGQFWVNNHAHIIADNARADLRFLEFFIELLDLKPFISGTAQPKLNRSNLDRIPVPFPPIELQREFARRVAAVEKLKMAQLASLTELDALFTALQHRAFRGEL